MVYRCENNQSDHKPVKALLEVNARMFVKYILLMFILCMISILYL